MKKFLTAGILSLAMATGVMAEDYSFEPVEISTPPATTVTQAPKTATTSTTSTTNVATPPATSENGNFQNALMQLDTAQVDLRDQLLEYKSKYSEVDAQYNKYKTERESLNKTIKQTEKKIKNIDKYKKNIRKDMM